MDAGGVGSSILPVGTTLSPFVSTNIIVDDPMAKDFAPFGDARFKIEPAPLVLLEHGR